VIDLSTLDVPAPIPTSVSAPFWEAATGGTLVLQHCESCGSAVFYPRRLCPHCWSDRLTWRAASGRGQLASWSVIHRAGHPGWQVATPYVIGLVRLDEGPTLLTLVLEEEGRLHADAPMEVVFTDIGGRILPCFRIAR
jgi:uncharacterized OB-fold protein